MTRDVEALTGSFAGGLVVERGVEGEGVEVYWIGYKRKEGKREVPHSFD